MKEVRYIKAINEALHEEMARDEKVFVIGEDVGAPGGAFGGTRGLLQAFGERRVKDTPISEFAIMGLALGAAMKVSGPSSRLCSRTSCRSAWTRSSIRSQRRALCSEVSSRRLW